MRLALKTQDLNELDARSPLLSTACELFERTNFAGLSLLLCDG